MTMCTMEWEKSSVKEQLFRGSSVIDSQASISFSVITGEGSDKGLG